MRHTNEGIGTAVIQPVLQQFAESMAVLEIVSMIFETDPGDASLAALRHQLRESEAAWAMSRAVEFGPAHSLGHSASLDTPADEGGLEHLLKAHDSAENIEEVDPSQVPSMQGFAAMEHVLHGDGVSKDAEAFSARERHYFRMLAQEAHQMALALQAAWFDGQGGHPAFNKVLATAGESGNSAYLTVESAAEEIARGSMIALSGLVGEVLPALSEAHRGDVPITDLGALHEVRGVLMGVQSSYLGLYSGGDRLLVEATSSDNAASVADGDRSGAAPRLTATDSGISHWVVQQDEQVDQELKTALQDALNAVEKMIQRHDEAATVSVELQLAQDAVIKAHDLLATRVVPLAQFGPDAR